MDTESFNGRCRRFFEEQIAEWPLAAANYESQHRAVWKDFFYDADEQPVPSAVPGGCRIRVVCLPERIGSSSARITAKGQVDRPCFLCPHRLPPEQRGLPLPSAESLSLQKPSAESLSLKKTSAETLSEENSSGAVGETPSNADFQLLVNPFPVFPHHFTLPLLQHRPQALLEHLEWLLRLAGRMTDSVLFYNGGLCGASAPDHLHFQAGDKGIMPLQADFALWRPFNAETLYERDGLRVSRLRHMLRQGWLVETCPAQDGPTPTSSVEKAALAIRSLIEDFGLAWQRQYGETIDAENKVNLLVWSQDGQYVCLLFPRRQHRPACYFSEGPDHMVTSPASVEMGGYYILPRREDFEKATPQAVAAIYREVSFDTAL